MYHDSCLPIIAHNVQFMSCGTSKVQANGNMGRCRYHCKPCLPRAYLWRLSLWHKLLSFDAGRRYTVVPLAASMPTERLPECGPSCIAGCHPRQGWALKSKSCVLGHPRAVDPFKYGSFSLNLTFWRGNSAYLRHFKLFKHGGFCS